MREIAAPTSDETAQSNVPGSMRDPTGQSSSRVNVLARGGKSGGERASGGMPDSMEPGARVSDRWSPGQVR